MGRRCSRQHLSAGLSRILAICESQSPRGVERILTRCVGPCLCDLPQEVPPRGPAERFAPGSDGHSRPGDGQPRPTARRLPGAPGSERHPRAECPLPRRDILLRHWRIPGGRRGRDPGLSSDTLAVRPAIRSRAGSAARCSNRPPQCPRYSWWRSPFRRRVVPCRAVSRPAVSRPAVSRPAVSRRRRVSPRDVKSRFDPPSELPLGSRGGGYPGGIMPLASAQSCRMLHRTSVRQLLNDMDARHRHCGIRGPLASGCPRSRYEMQELPRVSHPLRWLFAPSVTPVPAFRTEGGGGAVGARGGCGSGATRSSPGRAPRARLPGGHRHPRYRPKAAPHCREPRAPCP